MAPSALAFLKKRTVPNPPFLKTSARLTSPYCWKKSLTSRQVQSSVRPPMKTWEPGSSSLFSERGPRRRPR
ncbi:unnamed protein product [Pseudo-nitzschia multistriata]|uniref:Uncharacterized protein n=1 Tax=Pseudo-nitzschia multistriata TaxID=183589 RepID=A0A448ZS38_9STRA|nr:unnamed protein product [Pseudo-nitzschia multistriata]